MKLLSIEPTPSPNSMKLNLDIKLPPGQRYTFTIKQLEQAPEPLRSLLQIEGVRSIFRTADFIALDRRSGADWQPILEQARQLLAGDSGTTQGAGTTGQEDTAYGEAHVFVQMYRGIPMQLRVRIGDNESRSALPPQFAAAVSEAAGSGMIRERMLEDLGVRYGEPEEIMTEVVGELAAAYTDERLQELIEAAKTQGSAAPVEGAAPPRPAPPSVQELAERLSLPDWNDRYAAMERVSPGPEFLPLLAQALGDENASIRRLAVVYLGDLRIPEALPHLFTALKDRSPSVRRTAGDTLSDLGDPAAIGPMIEALGDSNKLVRWRAARYLYEIGDETALEALREAAGDEEFEIRLQAQMALERIERGEEAAGSVWQQMTASRRSGE
ncbi:conserved virulence factor C family protein [Paenibacillus sp. GCM10012307]|uniref:Conserved virulence factor C family protein n=1 Tax=Paenibacillus roseus TaxID=2798579 RepID=A0A934J2W8_9BACL|nr:conserved virulence factor C family protein [Paenibacillus roseus]MBJ6360483.1 conserved virulence factor C family protein [Paenibacillus roseus]